MRNGYAAMARKRYLLQAVIGSFFCSFATASASEPTLRETVDFIQRKSQETCVYAAGSGTVSPSVKGGSIYNIDLIGELTVTLLDHNTILVKEELGTRRGRYSILEGKFYDGVTVDYSIYSYISVIKVRLADLSTNVKITAQKSSSTVTIHRSGDISEGSPGHLWYGFQTQGKEFPIITAVYRVMVECTDKDCLEWNRTNRKRIEYNYINTENTERTGGPVEESQADEQADEQGSISSGTLFTVCSQENAERIKKALTHAIKLSGGKDELF